MPKRSHEIRRASSPGGGTDGEVGRGHDAGHRILGSPVWPAARRFAMVSSSA